MPGERQAELNTRVWAHEGRVRRFASRKLRAPEALIIQRYRQPLSGRVLELGCGAGRVISHLTGIADSVHGLDVSPAMVAYCRVTYPEASFDVGDLRDLSRFEDDSFEATLATCNVLDVLDDSERRDVFAQIGRILAPDGLLIMSSHNLAFAPSITRAGRIQTDSLRSLGSSVLKRRRRIVNHRALAPLERRERAYAILNDEALDFALLHYYISADAQERQLEEYGFELIECLDLQGRALAAGDTAPTCPELHYVARLRD